MFDNKYPYTDFSQLNLDWFLLKFKELLEEQERVSGKVKDLDDTVKEFTDFVTNYFDNLDVQAEVNVKLNEMAADGTLSDLLAPLVSADIGDVVAAQIGDVVDNQIDDVVADQIGAVVADQIDAVVAPEVPGAVTSWLNDNVDPVGSAVVVDSSLSVSGAAADAKATGDKIQNVKDKIEQLAVDGYYTIEGERFYVPATFGQINSVGDIDSSGNTCYVYLSANEMRQSIQYDNAIFKANICYKNNGSVVRYTSWLTTSPLEFDTDIIYDTIGINFRRNDSAAISETEAETTLYYETSNTNFGNLVTKNEIEDFIDKAGGLLQIYPDNFTSRLKPKIFLGNKYYANIDTEDYKISGESVVWVSTAGNDSTGDGSETNPYLTITKALTGTEKTIRLKEGTYIQGTHYTTSVNFAGRNVIGNGAVILQNDLSGHYVTISGSAYIENIVFKHGNTTVNSAVMAICSDSGNTVCFVNCTFRDGGANGLAVGGIDVIAKKCIAYGNKLDGFNYHARTVSDVTYTPNILEIDCVAYNNGTSESGSNSCNGSTSHDGAKIIRLNGEYYSCYGGVIADIALAEGEKTISVNYGVVAHNSTGVDQYKASFWASTNTEMYLYDCKSYGGTYDLSAFDDSKIVSRRLTTGRDVPQVYKSNSATVIQY